MSISIDFVILIFRSIFIFIFFLLRNERDAAAAWRTKYLFIIAKWKVLNIYRCIKIWFDFLNRGKLTQWRHCLHIEHTNGIVVQTLVYYFWFQLYAEHSVCMAQTYTRKCVVRIFSKTVQTLLWLMLLCVLCIRAQCADDCSWIFHSNASTAVYRSKLMANIRNIDEIKHRNEWRMNSCNSRFIYNISVRVQWFNNRTAREIIMGPNDFAFVEKL